MSRRVIAIVFDDDKDFGEVVNSVKQIFVDDPTVSVHAAIRDVARKIIAIFEKEPRQSNLVDHAFRELTILGENVETIYGYLEVIRAFSDMGHSGGSASVAIPTINALLQYKNLKPLTDDPAEWMFIAEDIWGSPGGIWQSRRNSEAFSNDGGRKYYLLSEGASDKHRKPLHKSEKKNK